MEGYEAKLSWLLDRFVEEIPGVQYVQTVSADGMHLASSDNMDRTMADTFAAVTSGLTSLCESASDVFEMTPFVRQVIETGAGWILLSRISSRANLAVITTLEADLGLIGYEMTLLIEQAGELLSPELVESMRNALDA
jgi:predicted regulator of Ras-like GTPase activity (Roadblock/LC7/MglB family)